MKKPWFRPRKITEQCFETSALSCGKVADVTTGSRHFAYTSDTFTGHLGPRFGERSRSLGGGGIGEPSASHSYPYTGICSNWISIDS